MLYDVETRILIAREHAEALRAQAATPIRRRRKWFADGHLPRTSNRPTRFEGMQESFDRIDDVVRSLLDQKETVSG